MPKKIYLNRTPEPEESEVRQSRIRLVPRGGTVEGSPLPRAAKSGASGLRGSPLPQKRQSGDASGAGSGRTAVVVVALAMVVILAVILFAATRDRTLPPVPAPRVTPESRAEAPRDPTWIKDYMQQHGAGEELKERQSRINRFRSSGDASGKPQHPNGN